MGLRRDGKNPLAYMGVRPQQVFGCYVKDRRPTTKDVFNFNVGDFWLIPKRDTSPSEELWQLASVKENIAIWINISTSTGELDVRKVEGDTGGEVLPTSGNKIYIKGGGLDVTTRGVPVDNTIFIDVAPENIFLKKVEITLNSAQLTALFNNNATQVLIPAQGTNKNIVVVSIYTLSSVNGGTGFTGGGGGAGTYVSFGFDQISEINSSYIPLLGGESITNGIIRGMGALPIAPTNNEGRASSPWNTGTDRGYSALQYSIIPSSRGIISNKDVIAYGELLGYPPVSNPDGLSAMKIGIVYYIIDVSF